MVHDLHLHAVALQVRLGRAELIEAVADLERHVIQAHGGVVGGRGIAADLEQREIVVVLARCGEEHHRPAQASDLAEPEHVAIERHGTLETSHLQDDVADALDMDRMRHGVDDTRAGRRSRSIPARPG